MATIISGTTSTDIINCGQVLTGMGVEEGRQKLRGIRDQRRNKDRGKHKKRKREII
jgi:hypothetical protein